MEAWSYPLSPFQPTNYCSYPYAPSPFNATPMLNTSIQTSLNSSSGYESAANETSFIDSCFSSTPQTIKEPAFKFIPQQSNMINDSDPIDVDDEMNENILSTSNEEHYHGRKKRRVLSRPQRHEANRRERQRMETMNEAYENLRNALPFKKGRKRQKMSRMDTVDGAIRYIQSLVETLHGPNYHSHYSM